MVATVTYNTSTRAATLEPSAVLDPGSTYTALVKGGPSGVKDLAGNALTADFSWTFTTSTQTPTYLSDRPWSSATSGWGPVELDRSNGDDGPSDGRPLEMNGVTYAKGLGVHAASEIRYSIAGCSSFTAQVGVDDEVGDNGSVVFQVWADTIKVFDSGVMTGASPTQSVNVSLTGRSELRLIVTSGGDNLFYDHADWADPSITCSN